MRGLVVVVLLWPVAHRFLVETREIDPWELFGWAMYSEPAARVQVRVDLIRDGRREPLRAMGPLRDAVRAFARRRTILGTLAAPDALAARVLASRPDADGVVLVLRRVRLDPRSRMLEAQDRTIEYVRGGDGRPRRLETSLDDGRPSGAGRVACESRAQRDHSSV
jgi:hypothetical protein